VEVDGTTETVYDGEVDAFFNAPTFAVRSAHQMAKQSLSMPTLKGILPSGALGDRGYQERRFLLPKLKGAISVIPSILQSLEGTVIKMSGYGRKRDLSLPSCTGQGTGHIEARGGCFWPSVPGQLSCFFAPRPSGERNPRHPRHDEVFLRPKVVLLIFTVSSLLSNLQSTTLERTDAEYQTSPRHSPGRYSGSSPLPPVLICPAP